MRVEQVDFISIPTRDAARAIAWYRDVLGLPQSRVTDGEVETPNVTLSFWEPEREDLPFVANEAGFGIRVADVATARAELEAQGVDCGPPPRAARPPRPRWVVPTVVTHPPYRWQRAYRDRLTTCCRRSSAGPASSSGSRTCSRSTSDRDR